MLDQRNEIQQKLDISFEKILKDMRIKREKKDADEIVYYKCVICHERHDERTLRHPYWWGSKGRVCPSCYSRIYKKYQMFGKNN